MKANVPRVCFFARRPLLSDIPAALQHRCVFITETDVFGYNLLPQAAAHLVAMRAC
jgi:hypothetical protein